MYVIAPPLDICRGKRFMQQAINAGISNQILATNIKSRVPARKHVSASYIDKFQISYEDNCNLRMQGRTGDYNLYDLGVEPGTFQEPITPYANY